MPSTAHFASQQDRGPHLEEFFHKLKSGEQQRVVVYGTSLTAGGEWANATKRWFDAHYPHLVTFINSGGPGENSDWGVANLESKVLSHHPDLVFIEFSYNDAHEKFEMPLERGAENLNRMVNAIRSRNPGTSIVLQTMNVGWDAPNGNRSASVRPHLQEFNDNYRRYAAAHGIPLLDHSLHWKKLKEDDAQLFQSYVPDGSHPTPDASLAVTWPPIEAFLSACHKSATQTS